jgi:hypothetical protein
MIEVKHFEFNVPHKCIVCKKKIAKEKLGVRFAPSGMGEDYLRKMRTHDLGQWVHAKRCFTKYFEAIDKQRAVE